jgi:hypothetical protein
VRGDGAVVVECNRRKLHVTPPPPRRRRSARRPRRFRVEQSSQSAGVPRCCEPQSASRC